MFMNKQNLEIFIITYNRSKLLVETLNQLSNSSLHNYKITVLDNKSTDNTALDAANLVAILPNLTVITNKENIGPNANFLRAFDYSNSKYTWVLCDDDIFDLSHFDDVLSVIEDNKIDLIHVGAHKQERWVGGIYNTPEQLLLRGYAYFRFSSFMPCNIFRTELFVKEYLVKGYNNAGNAYPHMPYLFSIYSENKNIYVSKQQIVFAQAGQSYSYKQWYLWWMKTCELLLYPKEVKKAYLNQWPANEFSDPDAGLKSLNHAQTQVDEIDIKYVNYFINRYFNRLDKIKLTYYRAKSHDISVRRMRDELYWARVKLHKKIVKLFVLNS